MSGRLEDDMRLDRCPNEDAVARAAGSGTWNEELAGHRDRCPICTEVSMVVAALAADADELAAHAPPPPDPGLIWLRSRLAARERQVKKATRWISVVQKTALASTVSVAIAFAPHVWRSLTEAFSRLDVEPAVATGGAGFPIPVLVGSFVLLGILALAELTGIREG
jgi:hypothetical protein